MTQIELDVNHYSYSVSSSFYLSVDFAYFSSLALRLSQSASVSVSFSQFPSLLSLRYRRHSESILFTLHSHFDNIFVIGLKFSGDPERLARRANETCHLICGALNEEFPFDLESSNFVFRSSDSDFDLDEYTKFLLDALASLRSETMAACVPRSSSQSAPADSLHIRDPNNPFMSIEVLKSDKF